MKVITIQIRVPAAWVAWIDRKAKGAGITRSAWVRHQIFTLLERDQLT